MSQPLNIQVSYCESIHRDGGMFEDEDQFYSNFFRIVLVVVFVTQSYFSNVYLYSQEFCKRVIGCNLNPYLGTASESRVKILDS